MVFIDKSGCYAIVNRIEQVLKEGAALREASCFYGSCD